jgi:hypothetical protein
MDGVLLYETTQLVGSLGITVSKVDSTIFISNAQANGPGAIGTLALYADDTGRLKSSGLGLTYNPHPEVLEVTNIVSNTHETSSLVTSYLTVKENIIAKNVAVDDIGTKNIVIDTGYVNYISFMKKNGDGRFAAIHTDFFKEDTLAVVTEKESGGAGCALTIDSKQRVSLMDGNLNLRKRRTVTSSKGERGDVQGDIAIDNEYLYYCTKSFNGIFDIWIRWKATDITW